jgi:hypothetical protein
MRQALSKYSNHPVFSNSGDLSFQVIQVNAVYHLLVSQSIERP